jgi:hypothetical protein
MTITIISSDLDQKVTMTMITEELQVLILMVEVRIDLIDGAHHRRTTTTVDEVIFVGGVPMEAVVVVDIKNNLPQP